ncbi:MAG: isoprenylcysteine carboxylmethyltransferase family protein [Candidatus Heimdallarchaeota archaeon]|nr:isoprenylcysteine carboxylmethyltransferase family protein [Candidatus Heimdallarchaeota archaeon]
MVNYDIIAYYLVSNILLYFIIHIPLDILSFKDKREKYKEGAKEYSPWENQNLTKIITVIASIYFWIFSALWPILHLLSWDNFIMIFNFEIPIVGKAFQIVGMIIIGFGTFIACIGRIARKTKAISWGVPKKLTVKLGFSVVRHPLYASYCYYFLGIPLTMMNYLLIPLVVGIIGYYYTTKYEEEILVEEFGDEYIAYQRKVGMLIPFIGRYREKK